MTMATATTTLSSEQLAEKKQVEASINHVMQPTSVEAAAKLADHSASDTYEIKGYDLNKGVDFAAMLDSYMSTGFQATNFAKAVDEINRMVNAFRSTLHLL